MTNMGLSTDVVLGDGGEYLCEIPVFYFYNTNAVAVSDDYFVFRMQYRKI
jgi:hypothetical protein